MIVNKKRSLSQKLVGLLILLIAFIIWVMINYYEKMAIAEDYQKRLLIIDKLEKFDLSSVNLDEISFLDSLDPKLLEVGENEMTKHKVVIVGIARDNMDDILVMIKNIDYIGGLFKDYRVIIFENDSKDGTKIALDIWQKKNSKIKIVSEDFANKKRPNHKFMAEVRNKYLSELEDKEYNEFDIVMMVDIDMSYGIDIRAIEDSFSKIDRWDAVCANGIANAKGRMYDMFAFRNDEFPFSPKQWQEICSMDASTDKWVSKCEKGVSLSKGWIHDAFAFRSGWQGINRLYWLRIVPQGQKIYPVNSNLVPVESCFGGLAFYKHEFIEGCRYDSIDDDCEHVSFHRCLKDKHNGKMMMNPAQIIRYSQY